jgi:hypothetical protein
VVVYIFPFLLETRTVGGVISGASPVLSTSYAQQLEMEAAVVVVVVVLVVEAAAEEHKSCIFQKPASSHSYHSGTFPLLPSSFLAVAVVVAEADAVVAEAEAARVCSSDTLK